MPRRSVRRRIWAAVGVALLVTLAGTPPAHAETPAAETLVFDGRLTPDGTLEATTTITFDEAPDQLVQKLALESPIDQFRSHSYDISEVSATVGGVAVTPELSRSGNQLVVTVDTAGAGGEPITISYEVDGTTSIERGETQDLTVFEWRVLQGLNAQVRDVSGTLRLPSIPLLIDCIAGPPGTIQKCDLYAAGTTDQPVPYFRSLHRGMGEQVTLTVGVGSESVAATAVVQEDWNLNRAFRLSPWTALSALAALVLGGTGILWLFRRKGLDVRSDDEFTPVAVFRPVGEGESTFEVQDLVRPGHVGTVADEHVDPVDVTATILDLAVRGHLVITEMPYSGGAVQDWRLERTHRTTDRLAGFEVLLLDAIAPAGEHGMVSGLPTSLAPALADVQSALYDDVVERGWFDGRPDSTRGNWRRTGWILLAAALVAGGALVAFTSHGLLALVLVLLASLMIWVGGRMPRRTKEGAMLLNGLGALSSVLATWPTDQMPRGREMAEISKLLPYAVVLGGRQRWVEAMVAADDEDIPDDIELGWYRAPEGWTLPQLPASLTQFIHVVQGVLFSR